MLKTQFSKVNMNIEAGDELSSIIEKSFLSVPFSLKISKSEISPNDLFAFLPQLKDKLALPKTKDNNLGITGSFTGSTDALKIDNLNLSTKSGLGLFASGIITSLTNLRSAKCEINFRTTSVTQIQVTDLAHMAGKSLKLPAFKPLIIQGSVNNSLMAPELVLTIRGASGNIRMNGSVDLTDRSYAMELLFSDLELGELAGIKELKRVSGSIDLSGKGFIPDSIRATALVSIDTAGFKGYSYHHVNIELKADTGAYTFGILSSDTAARCDLSGYFSQYDGITEGRVSGNFAIQPGKLSFYPDSIAIRGEMEAFFQQAPAGILASLDIRNLLLKKGDHTEELKKASISLQSGDSLIKAGVETDFLTADLQSHGSFTDLKNAFQVDKFNIISVFDSAFIYNPPVISALPETDFSLEASYDPIIGLLVPDSVFSFQKVDIALTKDNSGIVKAEMKVDRYHLKNLSGFASSLQWESVPGKASLLVKTDSIKVESIALGASVIELNLKEEAADFSLKIRDRKDSVRYDIATEAVSKNQRLAVRSTLPQWILNGNAWDVSQEEFLVAEPGTNDFIADLHWKNGQRVIDIHGRRSETLYFDCNKVLLSMLVIPGIIPYGFDTELNGKIDFHDTDQKLGILLDMKQMVLSEKPLGNMKITGSYLSDTLGTVESEFYAVMNDTTELMVTAKLGNDLQRINTTFKNIPVYVFETFVGKYLSGLRGGISGGVELTSTRNNPSLNGSILLNEAAFKIIPLNAKFSIPEDKIILDNNQLLFDQFIVLDSLRKRLIVNGMVDINDLANVTADLQVSSDNLQVMNTTEKENPAFNGSVFINSKLNITGPVQKPSITGNLVLAGGTVINYRYMEDLTISETQKTITFASLTYDSSALDAGRTAVLELSKSPYMEASIEIDPKSIFNFQITRGFDIGVQIRGGGFLNYAMLPNNTMSLSGIYEIQQGKAELKIIGWPRKYFTITPGSTLRWNGKLEDPELQLVTTSKVRGSYLNPVDNKNREVDFIVYMKLANRLSQLEIVFDVISADQYLTTVLGTLSKEERMRQAINLLIFERIELPNMTSSSSYVTQQINQFWESQLNQFTKSAIKGVDISFGVNTYTGASEGGGEQEYTSLSYEVKKEMFQERGSVIVSGKMNDNSPSSSQTNNMIENFTFEYALDTNRSKYLKVYRQQNYEDLLEGEVTKSGVGFIYRKNYDRLRDIWRRKKKKTKD